MLKKNSSLLLCCFFSMLLAKGQPLQFKRLTVNDGLSQNSVYDIQFDKYGFLWAATADGLNRYDGYTFTQYRKSGSKNLRLNNTSIFDIACDPEGKIWIAGSEGLEVLNPLNNTVHLLMAIHTTFKEAKWYYDSSLHSMIIFVRNKGAWQYDIHSLREKKIISASSPNVTAKYYNLSILPSGKKNELLLFARGSSSVYTLNLFADTITNSNIFSSEKDYIDGLVSSFGLHSFVFVATINMQSWLVEFDRNSKQIIRKKSAGNLYGDPFFKSTLYVPSLQRIIVSDFNRGLIFYDTAFNETGNYPNATVLSASIGGVVFQCLTVKDNCLWLGSDPNGITYSNLSPQQFHHFKNNYSSSAPIVKGVFTDQLDNVYSCLLFDGVQVFDKNGNYLHDLKKIGGHGDEPLRLQAFNSFIPISKDSVFIHCTNYMGFYNTATGAFYNYQDQFSEQTRYPYNFDTYNQAFPIGNNTFFITYYNKLFIARFSGKNLQLQKKDSVSSSISSLYAIDENHYLIGTESGLYFSANNKKSFSANIGALLIKHINHDLQGNYWICTPDGLWQLNAQLQLVKHFTTDNGLPNNFTYGTLIDNNKLWVSTNYGLSKMDMPSVTFTNYSVTDGLQSNEFNSCAFWKAGNGKLYFGGINGITEINDIANTTINHSFPVAIMQIKVNDKIWNADTAAWNITQLQLSHNNNTLSFDFSGILPSQSQQLLYRYKMDGADNDWVYADKNRVVRYADLSPGNYTFNVAASLNNKDWSAATIININITPPFWKTTWFRILIALCCIALLWFIIRRYNERKYKKQIDAIKLQQQLEEERQRISRDLHDNMGAYTSALIANVEKLKTKTGEDEDVLKMQSNAEQILGSLRETIWVLNNKEISISDFSDGFKNYCFKLLKNFEHISFDAQEDIQQNKNLTASTAIHLNKILQEVVQNIIKHSAATQISYSISYTNELKVIVADNGNGFDKATTKKGNGLDNMQWRAKQAEATIEIISQLGVGTTIVIKK